MTLTGISLQEVSSGGGVAPAGQEYKQAYFAEDASVTTGTEMHIISISTDLTDPLALNLTNTVLVDELETARANSDSSFYAILHLSPITPEGLTDLTVADHIEEVVSSYEVSTLVFVKDADLAFATAVDTAISLQNNQKQYLEALLRFRKAGTDTPTEYADAFDLAFDTFSSSSISIVAPTTQDNWLGAVAGRISRIAVQASAGKVLDGGLKNVSTDPAYSQGILSTLDSSRALVLKRFVEDPSSVYVNDDLVMHSAVDTVTTMAQRRVLNKAKREILFYAFPLINDDKFNKDESGAMACALIAGKGLEVMKKASAGQNQQISDYSLAASWITGGVAIAFSVNDVNRIKIVDSTIELTA